MHFVITIVSVVSLVVVASIIYQRGARTLSLALRARDRARAVGAAAAMAVSLLVAFIAIAAIGWIGGCSSSTLPSPPSSADDASIDDASIDADEPWCQGANADAAIGCVRCPDGCVCNAHRAPVCPDAGELDAGIIIPIGPRDLGGAPIDCNPCPLTCPECIVDPSDCSITGCEP